uniref:Uncharacterized protein n=1 Tax=Trichogramma kaykai TaxID=54128 RepID=A0ABD2W9B4_9HYME
MQPATERSFSASERITRDKADRRDKQRRSLQHRGRRLLPLKTSSGNETAWPRRCLVGARLLLLLLLLSTLPVRRTHDHEDTEQQLPGGPAAGWRRGDRAARGEPPGQARLRVHLQQDLRRQQRVPHDADRREGHRQGRGLRGHRGRRSRPHLRHARLHHTQVHGHALPRHHQGQEAALQKDTLRPGLLR